MHCVHFHQWRIFDRVGDAAAIEAARAYADGYDVNQSRKVATLPAHLK
jgi:hypothetical protein